MQNAAILVFANKQDLSSALSAAQVSEQLGLTSVKDRQWHICAAVAKDGTGLTDGLDWLTDVIKNS